MFQFDCITFDPLVTGDRACIRGLRVTAALVVNLVANSMTAEIVKEYPYLEEEDVRQAAQYAAWKKGGQQAEGMSDWGNCDSCI